MAVARSQWFEVYDAQTGWKLADSVRFDRSGWGAGTVINVQYSHDSREIVSVSDTCVRVWDSTTGTPRSNRIGALAVGVELSPDGTKFVCDGDSAGLWDIRSGRRILVFAKGEVTAVVFSPDGTLVAASYADEKSPDTGYTDLWSVSE